MNGRRALMIFVLGLYGLASQVIRTEDVETLLKHASKLDGQTVRVEGEVQEKKGSAFILSDGEAASDEIAVIPSAHTNREEFNQLSVDEKVIVTGVLRSISPSKISEEYDLEFESDPQSKDSFTTTTSFIVADQITPTN